MGQLGFFDLNRRYESLDEKNDPLVAIAAMVPFESFRTKLKVALIKGELRTSDATRKSLAGRNWDEVMIFNALVLQATQIGRGERDDQGRRNAGRLEIQARQEPPEGQGRALDEEA